jgi:hypothetical protein
MSDDSPPDFDQAAWDAGLYSRGVLSLGLSQATEQAMAKGMPWRDIVHVFRIHLADLCAIGPAPARHYLQVAADFEEKAIAAGAKLIPPQPSPDPS